MECHNIQNMMPLFLAGEMDQSQGGEVREHLMHCTQCQQELDAYKETWSLLDAWQDEEPAPGYISRFWTRVALERSWWEKFQDAFGELLTAKRLVAAISTICAVVIIGTFTIHTTQTRQTEALLTDLTVDEIEFVENLDLAENLEFLEDMDMLENMDILEEMSSGHQMSERDYA